MVIGRLCERERASSKARETCVREKSQKSERNHGDDADREEVVHDAWLTGFRRLDALYRELSNYGLINCRTTRCSTPSRKMSMPRTLPKAKENIVRCEGAEGRAEAGSMR